MRRFFADKMEDGLIAVSGTDFLHIRDVLRMRQGDNLVISVAGGDYICEISSIEADRAICKVFQQINSLTEPKVGITLFQGLPKNPKMDLIIQKCVELGVKKIVPVCCERSVVRLTAQDAVKKTERWRRQAYEAAKQSGRGEVPIVGLPVNAGDIVSDSEIKLLFWEEERNTRLKNVLPEGARSMSIFIGPEGGITDAEVNMLIEKGFSSVTLGNRILRTETAGLAAVSAIMYHYDELG